MGYFSKICLVAMATTLLSANFLATVQAFVLPSSRVNAASSLSTKMMGASTAEAGEKTTMTATDVKNGLMAKIMEDPNLKLPDQFQQALTDILDGMTEVAEETGEGGREG
ncbi:hypothetical protein Naga_100562g3, partial [Nannochloropsis gaditana]